MRSRVHLALGLFGVGCAGVGLWVWWKSVSGPGDDNPIGLAGLGATALALVPAWGLVLWARGRALRAHLVWLFFAGLAAVPLTAGLLVLWSIIRRGMP